MIDSAESVQSKSTSDALCDQNARSLSDESWDLWRNITTLEKTANRPDNSTQLLFEDIYPTGAKGSDCSSAMEDVEAFQKYLNSNFDKIDVDKDGAITVDEIELLKGDSDLSNAERKALKVLKDNFDDYAAIGLDGIDWMLTKEDLKQFERGLQVHARAFDLYGMVKDEFCNVDVDGDGYLSLAEIDQAIADSKTDWERTQWQLLRVSYDQINRLHDDGGLTLSDVLSYSASGAAGEEQADLETSLNLDLLDNVVCQ